MAAPDSFYHEPFRRKQATKALLAAVTELAKATGYSLDAMEEMTYAQIGRLAASHYGDALPEFWSTWLDWFEDQTQPMGEL